MVENCISVEVEFYGIPRLRVGVPKVQLRLPEDNAVLSAALKLLADQFPELAIECLAGDRLQPGYLMSVNGDRFVTDPQTPLKDGASLLLLTADAGG